LAREKHDPKRIVAFIVLVSMETAKAEELELATRELNNLIEEVKKAKYWRIESTPIIEQE
jgi:hypothetical protein